MNTETTKAKKFCYTDKDRDNVLFLSNNGVSTSHIVNMLGIAKSSVQNIKRAYTLCLTKQYEALSLMCRYTKPTVEWAMRVTNTAPAVIEPYLNASKPVEKVADPAVIPETVTREDFLAMYATMQDVRSLLTEIRDVLNEIK